MSVTRFYKDWPACTLELKITYPTSSKLGVHIDKTAWVLGRSLKLVDMEHLVKMRNTFALRTVQFIDEGYSEMFV